MINKRLDKLLAKVSGKLKRAMVYYHLVPLLDDNREAWDKWLDSHNDHLKAIPAELIKTTEGYLQVIQYLKAEANR